ncbi:MAG: type II toxin-antitoxin system PemK/MazF family toxin [Patescibacteria group bacterium]
MRQGEIWFADLNPTKGSEQSGKRPVVIVSGDTLNDTLPIVIVVPITSKIKSYPTCVLLLANKTNGLPKDSEAIPFQIRAIAKKRLTKRIGHTNEEELREILKGLFLALTH